MVTFSGPQSRNDLSHWLESLPFNDTENARIACAIAHRAALRVVPVHWHWVGPHELDRPDYLSAIPVLTCVLISGVLGTMRHPEVKALGTQAAAAAASDFPDTSTTPPAALAAINAALAGFAAGNSNAHMSYVYAVRTIASAAQAAPDSADIWDAVSADCTLLEKGGIYLDDVKLWPAENPVLALWQDIRRDLPEGWEFWRDWVQDALDGVKPDAHRLAEIARIGQVDWEKGSRHVNALIANIVGS